MIKAVAPGAVRSHPAAGVFKDSIRLHRLAAPFDNERKPRPVMSQRDAVMVGMGRARHFCYLATHLYHAKFFRNR
jgi:hypothetical protein